MDVLKTLPGMERPCRACGRMLIFAHTRNGKTMPLTADVQVGGNVMIFLAFDDTLECTVLPQELATELNRRNIPMRVSHHSHCPRAEEFRSTRLKTRREGEAKSAQA